MAPTGTATRDEVLDPAAVMQAYLECQAITRASSTNFYYAFLTLPPQKRYAIYATYAFCRLCDDIVDDPARRETAESDLADLRKQLQDAYDVQPNGPVWTALADAQRRFGIPMAHFNDVIDGCEMDLTKNRYETFAELVQYCRRVASAPGLICVEVFGYTDAKAVEYAIDLGIAMQLTNITRDVAEDARDGRVYLPQEELQKFGYSVSDLMAGTVNDSFRDLMKFQIERAHRYFESGARLFPLLDRRSRACPRTMSAVYRRLLGRIEAADYDVFSERISLSRTAKAALAAKLWIQSRIPVLS